MNAGDGGFVRLRSHVRRSGRVQQAMLSDAIQDAAAYSARNSSRSDAAV